MVALRWPPLASDCPLRAPVAKDHQGQQGLDNIPLALLVAVWWPICAVRRQSRTLGPTDNLSHTLGDTKRRGWKSKGFHRINFTRLVETKNVLILLYILRIFLVEDSPVIEHLSASNA